MFYTTNPGHLEQLIQTHDVNWSPGMEFAGIKLIQYHCHVIMYYMHIHFKDCKTCFFVITMKFRVFKSYWWLYYLWFMNYCTG